MGRSSDAIDLCVPVPYDVGQPKNAANALLPGTEVRVRGLRWEVVSTEPLGQQTLCRLRGLESGVLGVVSPEIVIRWHRPGEFSLSGAFAKVKHGTCASGFCDPVLSLGVESLRDSMSPTPLWSPLPEEERRILGIRYSPVGRGPKLDSFVKFSPIEDV